MRIVFFGTPESAVPSLEALVEGRPGWEVVAVVTQPDRPAGRGRSLKPGPVKERATQLGVPVLAPQKLKEIKGTLAELRPDVAAVVAYGHIFRRWLLELPTHGCVNVHFSKLPRHRGVAPVAWAILEGDAETAVTTMRMDRGVDTGDVYAEDVVPIEAEDTTGSLTEKLADRGGALLARTITAIEDGTAIATPQAEEGTTYARRLEKEDGRIEWSRPAGEIERRVRAMSPWPGAWTTFQGQLLKVHSANVGQGALPPGALQRRAGLVVVGTGDGLLALEGVQIQGKPRTEAAAWIRGARPRDIEILGREE